MIKHTINRTGQLNKPGEVAQEEETFEQHLLDIENQDKMIQDEIPRTDRTRGSVVEQLHKSLYNRTYDCDCSLLSMRLHPELLHDSILS
jgi:hypothetical protein